MMKLELKYLVPYLPYKLKVNHFGTIKILNCGQGSSKHWVGVTSGLKYQDFVKFAPILRPLSDLRNNIEINGERFIPRDTLNFMYPSESIGLNPASWSYRVIVKLFEWHFDVFGLIKNELAVDINTLTQKENAPQKH